MKEIYNKNNYAFKTSWGKYVLQPEVNRFLSNDKEDLLKICNCIDLKSKNSSKISAGIPIHYEDEKIYVLKEGPHDYVEGESGSKKSRTIARGKIITSVLTGNSCIITDPKGEICSDSKILDLLKRFKVKVNVIDFRTFDKDGYNIFNYIFEMMKKGKKTKAINSINKYVEMLKHYHEGGDDPFWNGQGGDKIRLAMIILLLSLIQIPEGEKRFNLKSIKSFIRQDKDHMQSIFTALARQAPKVKEFNDMNEIIKTAERTYACIVSSANALLSEFTSTDALIEMLSVSTFDIKNFYEEPSVLFLVFPDEHKTYNMVTGFIIDQLYQILVETFGEKYQNIKEPKCFINFICDEVANLNINDLSSKVSASRSRNIDWTLIAQSQKQMADTYSKDWGTIEGNCKNKIFLGSSDYHILNNISEQVGVTYLTKDGQSKALVSVDDLRKMRKEREFKDALILTGNHIYCAQLPDYEQFSFLRNNHVEIERKLSEIDIQIYTPECVLRDLYQGIISFDDIENGDIEPAYWEIDMRNILEDLFDD